MSDQSKRCSKCELEFPSTLEYFPPRKEAPDGLRGVCRECRRNQNREWREDNAEHLKEYKDNYYAEHAEYIREQVRLWREQNPERQAANNKKWREENIERSRQLNRESNQRHKDKRNKRAREHYLENIDAQRRKGKEYYQNNKGRVLIRCKTNRKKKPDLYAAINNASGQRRRARKRSLPCGFTSRDWRTALDYFNHRCAACGEPAGLWTTLAMDHWIPIASPDCPGTIPSNIVPLCHPKKGMPVGENAPCNLSKHNKLPDVWLKKRFGQKKAKEILERVHKYFEWINSQ